MPIFFSSTNETESLGNSVYGINPGAGGATFDAVQATSKTDYGIPTTMAGVGVGAVVDLADTVVSSVPGLSTLTGMGRGELNNKVLSSLGMPGLNKFYADHKDAIEVTSGIYGAVGSELLTRGIGRALAPTWQRLSTAPYARRVVALDTQYERAMESLRAADTALAQKALIGGEAFGASARVPVSKWTNEGLVTTMETYSRSLLNTRAIRTAGLLGARRAAATELVMAATLNTNSFLYDTDEGQNIAWMVAGIGLGAVGEMFSAGRQISKFNKSDTLSRMRAEATDPTGLEQKSFKNPFQSPKAVASASSSYLGALQGTWFDEATSLLVQAHAAPDPKVDPSVWNKLKLSKLSQAQVAIDTSLQKGILFDSQTRAVMHSGKKMTPEGVAVNQVLLRDPVGFHGMEMLGKVPDGHTAEAVSRLTKDKITARLEELQEKLVDEATKDKDRPAILTEIKQLNYADKTAPVAIIDGEVLPINYAKPYDNWAEPQIYVVEEAGQSTYVAKGQDGEYLGITIEGNLLPRLSEGRSFEDLGHLGKLNYFRTMERASKGLVAKFNSDPKFVLALPKDAHWTQLDAAEYILEQTNGTAKIQFAGLTRETAQVESFAQKVRDMKLRGEDLANPEMGPLLRVQYNLPRLNAYQMGLMGSQISPLDIVTMGATKKLSYEEIRAMSLGELKTAIASTKHVSDLSSMAPAEIKSLSGNSFTFLKDENGEVMKPLVGFSRSLKPHEWVRDNLSERIAISKIQQTTKLLTHPGAEFVSSLTRAVSGSEDFAMGMQVSGLADIQMQMNVPGLHNKAPSSAMGSLARELNPFATTEFVHRGNLRMQAIRRTRELVDNFTRDWAKQSIESAFGDTLNQLAGPASAKSRWLLDQFHTPGVSSGWDLMPEVVRFEENGETLYGFTLANTDKNRRRFKTQFQTDMREGQALLGPNRKEVVLDELAYSIQQSFNKVTADQRVNENSIQRANRLQETVHTPFYVPPPSMKGKFISYVVDVNGNVVQGGTIIENSDALRKKAVATMKADPTSVANVPGNIIREQGEIEAFLSLVDKAQRDLIDPGTIEVAGQRGSLGKLGAPKVKVGSFKESLSHLQERYGKISNLVFETISHDQVAAAQARAQVVSGSAWFGEIKFNSIYDEWLNEFYGRSKINPSKSVVGTVYTSVIERTFNSVMAESAPTAARVWQATSDFITHRMPFGLLSNKESAAEFDQLTSKLARFMPFQTVDEMIELKNNGSNPWTLAKATAGVAKFTATMMLRVAETAHPIMNMAGIINASPAVIRTYSPRAGETIEEFSERVGHSANIFSKDGKVYGAADMAKLAKRGFERAWNLAPDDEYVNYAIRNGMISQEVAEFDRAFRSAEISGKVKQFLVGDPRSKDKFLQKGAIGWASILSDKSEDFSRSWAHHIGLQIAEDQGIKSVQAANQFAHDLANKMIANYNPRNRSAIFQGAVGSNLGLFQSFMVNYWQRIFSHIENKEYKSAAIQAATQAGIFGLVTIPGYNEFNEFIFNNSDGKKSLTDGINQHFGLSTGDLLLGGTISNLPKLFGVEAVDLYSRGDVQIRSPVFEGVSSMPAVSLMTKIWEGVSDAANLFSEKNPQLTPAQVGEVLSNMIPNRPIAGMIETFLAGGKDTDSYSQLVSENLSTMESVYRVMGLRSMRQSKEVEAYYSNRKMQEIKAAHDEGLREATRALLRTGDTSRAPEIFEAYVTAGNNPDNFRRWIRDQFNTATDTKSQIMLKEMANDPNLLSAVERLSSAQVEISDEETERDPQFDYPALQPDNLEDFDI